MCSYMNMSERINLAPFLKWAGGKKQILNDISARFPTELGKQINKYAEPFIGGGAVLFYVLQNYELKEVYISDINKELINTYSVIKTSPDDLIEQLKKLEDVFLELNKNERKEFYLKKRERFNELKRKAIFNLELAALFIFINRTCFNGLYRVNSKGDYNVPMGDYKNPKTYDEKNIREISNALQNVNIVCGDFKQCKDFVDSATFVYFDPPYRPLSNTSNFTSYTENSFDDDNQIDLANFYRFLDSKGVYLLESNSDPKNANESDSFFDDLYSGFTIDRISAFRMINSKVAGRGRVSELLIRNY